MAQIVIGFFEDSNAAHRAADELVSQGFPRNEVDIASPARGDNEAADNNRDGESGVKRFFKSLFGEGDEADRYSNVSHGCAMVTVHAQTAADAERAADVMDDYGAIDIDERATGQIENSRYSNSNNPGRGDIDYRDSNIDQPVNRDSNAPMQSGEPKNLRQRSRIVERPFNDDTRNRDEQSREEENPIDRTASGSRLELFKEGEIELTERKEIPIVNKEARIVEEVSVRKEVKEREETIHDTVRNTEVDIDKLPADENVHRSGLSETGITGNEKRTSPAGNRGLDLRVEKKQDNKDWDDKGNRRGDPLFGA